MFALLQVTFPLEVHSAGIQEARVVFAVAVPRKPKEPIHLRPFGQTVKTCLFHQALSVFLPSTAFILVSSNLTFKKMCNKFCVLFFTDTFLKTASHHRAHLDQKKGKENPWRLCLEMVLCLQKDGSLEVELPTNSGQHQNSSPPPCLTPTPLHTSASFYLLSRSPVTRPGLSCATADELDLTVGSPRKLPCCAEEPMQFGMRGV